jgi:hypothetical protein
VTIFVAMCITISQQKTIAVIIPADAPIHQLGHKHATGDRHLGSAAAPKLRTDLHEPRKILASYTLSA